MTKQVLFIGALPHPTHGMSTINKRMLEKLKSSGISVNVYNTVPAGYENTNNKTLWEIKRHVRRILQIPLIWLQIFLHRKERLYVSISGGYGQIYDIASLLPIMLINITTHIHHHSFAYLNSKTRIANCLLKYILGKAHHIVLCEQMALRLSDNYEIDHHNINVISNMAFFDYPQYLFTPKKELTSIGYISNISFDKGIDTFLEIVLSSNFKALGKKAIIAGPFESPNVRNFVLDKIKDNHHVTYLGPVYGDDKLNFFKSVDLLVFPTKYPNEAEPIIIYEAFQAGVPVISTQRGCIKSMLNSNTGLSMNIANFVASSTELITELAHDASRLERLSTNSRKHFEQSKFQATKALDGFLSTIHDTPICNFTGYQHHDR